MSSHTPTDRPANPPFLRRLWEITRRGLVLEMTLRRLPPRYAAVVDRFRRGQRDPFGGPLNGQPARRRLVEAILQQIPFDRIVETGTFRGSTAEYLARLVSLPILTVEVVERFFAYSVWRLRWYQNVTVVHGDSITFLKDVGARFGDETIFYYLDAHWEDHLPLREELEVIASSRRWVALIDDFQVPNDPGYGFDDYGPDRRLTLDYLHLERWPDLAVFWPATPSAEEGGSRRGCLVLASPAIAPALDDVQLLRRGARA